jgi:hypothetical protein
VYAICGSKKRLKTRRCSKVEERICNSYGELKLSKCAKWIWKRGVKLNKGTSTRTLDLFCVSVKYASVFQEPINVSCAFKFYYIFNYLRLFHFACLGVRSVEARGLDYIVAYRPVARQRPRKKQLLQPMLCNMSIKKTAVSE